MLESRLLALFAAAALATALAACSSVTARPVRFGDATELHTLGALGTCDAEHSPSTIDPRGSLVILVHGCNSSLGRFRALSSLFALHGQQTLCFRYDDRRRIGDVARELNASLSKLAAQRESSELIVLGHSQGGLVARAAMALHDRQPVATRRGPLTISLVTVSAPFNGIEAAADCGARWLHAVSLGATLAVCRGIAGAKWRDIHPSARMVQEPGRMSSLVRDHLEIRTDERNTCRTRGADGRCARDDFVFSVREQQNLRIVGDQRVTPETVAAGHAEIVGSEETPPRKLLSLLQRHRVLRQTPPEKERALQALLERLF